MTDWSVICNHQRVIEAHKRQKEIAGGPVLFFSFYFLNCFSFKKEEGFVKNLKNGDNGEELGNRTIIESLYIALDMTTQLPNRYS